jgi:Sigma 54 modulation protein / S30EA ribosomal protein
MHIQLNTDARIEGTEKFASHIKEVVEHSMGHFRRRITRVEVHLSDENAVKTGTPDKRCVMEARLEGHPPTAVTSHAPSLEEAVAGAAHKLRHAVDSLVGRLDRR